MGELRQPQISPRQQADARIEVKHGGGVDPPVDRQHEEEAKSLLLQPRLEFIHVVIVGPMISRAVARFFRMGHPVENAASPVWSRAASIKRPARAKAAALERGPSTLIAADEKATRQRVGQHLSRQAAVGPHAQDRDRLVFVPGDDLLEPRS